MQASLSFLLELNFSLIVLTQRAPDPTRMSPTNVKNCLELFGIDGIQLQTTMIMVYTIREVAQQGAKPWV